MNKERFIVIEGTDGSGKTVQLELLKERLTSEGKIVKTVDFPQYSETFFGKMVGRFLKGDFGGLDQVDPHLAALVYAGDRWQAKEKISRWLAEGTLVLANRYTGANMAFQTARMPEEKRDEFLNWLEELEYHIYQIPREDIVIFLHVPVEISQQLLEKKGHRDYLGGQKKDINESNIEYQREVERVYFKLIKKYPHWVLVECCDKEGQLMPPEKIHELVYNVLLERGIL